MKNRPVMVAALGAGTAVLMACALPARSPAPFAHQPGDLLFQDLDCGSLCDAIESVTVGTEGAKLSHVGMVSRAGYQGVWILEAYANGVEEVSLEAFLARSKDAGGRPKVLVGRLRQPYQGSIPRALAVARRLLGKPYDDVFDANNDRYYCSELVYEAFRDARGGEPLFALAPMTFHAPSSDAPMAAWVDTFRALQRPVPEGRPGINPGAISSSPALLIVHAYGNPSGWRSTRDPPSATR
jgi:hypothetical protein